MKTGFENVLETGLGAGMGFIGFRPRDEAISERVSNY
jgi:hypothetical protein